MKWLSAVAWSSAEAEFYAMVEGAQRAKWAETVAEELGFKLGSREIVLGTDSGAAKSFVARGPWADETHRGAGFMAAGGGEEG